MDIDNVNKVGIVTVRKLDRVEAIKDIRIDSMVILVNDKAATIEDFNWDITDTNQQN